MSDYNILIVDDSVDDRFFCKKNLSAVLKSATFFEAESLALGMDMLRSNNISFILLDYNLPDGTGVDFINTISGSDTLVLPAVIILTSAGDERIAMESVKAGAMDYLIKDNLTGDQLHKAIIHAQERKQSQDNLRYLATHDALTNLPNRTLLHDRLTQKINFQKRNNTRFAVLFLDLDGFKNVNDTLGHQIGDILLVAAADRLKMLLRSTDTIARFGGDEFVVVIGDIKDTSDAVRIANLILSDLEKEFKIQGNTIRVTGSIGIAMFPDDAETADDIIRYADTAMYDAKNSGKNIYKFFSSELEGKAMCHFEMSTYLISAWENGHFMLYYQPIIDFATDKVCKYEALIRLRKDEEVLTPTHFLPTLEDSSLIIDIGYWTLSEAIQAAMQVKCPVAVNLSPKQIQSNNFYSEVVNILETNSYSPSLLELEITEDALLDAHENTVLTLENLNEFGLSIAIDDFGTGYSCIKYIKDYPVDTIKIDRYFIQNIHEQENDKDLVGSLIKFCHSLQLKVVAEGIETKEQYIILKNLGCDYGQGNFMGMPGALEQIKFDPLSDQL